jgi:hypothetical protein
MSPMTRSITFTSCSRSSRFTEPRPSSQSADRAAFSLRKRPHARRVSRTAPVYRVFGSTEQTLLDEALDYLAESRQRRRRTLGKVGKRSRSESFNAAHQQNLGKRDGGIVHKRKHDPGICDPRQCCVGPKVIVMADEPTGPRHASPSHHPQAKLGAQHSPPRWHQPDVGSPEGCPTRDRPAVVRFSESFRNDLVSGAGFLSRDETARIGISS